MKYFTTGSSGADYLLLNQNMYSISKLSSTYVVSVIECNIEEKWMTVKQRWKYEMEWSEVNLDCLVQEDIINISDRGDRWEGNSLYGVPFGFGCYYNEENVLIYKGFVFDNKKMCYGCDYYPDQGCIEYEGSFYNNMRYGYGKYYDKKGTCTYEGEWYNNNILSVSPIHIKSELNNHDIQFIVEEILIDDHCTCDMDDFILINYCYLKKIEIGYDCFEDIQQVVLKSIVILNN